MSRKLLLIAVPAMACLFTLGVADGSSAFAKGREMGHGPVVKNGRDFGRDFRHFDRHFDRYGRGYGYFGYTAPVCETVAPVCTTCDPVVTTVCPTCDPVYVGSSYGHWGYNHFRKNFHNPPHRFQPLNSRGGMGRRG